MKIRNGFVSNSSSSSFVVVGNVVDPTLYKSLTDDVYFIGRNGEIEFGWEECIYRGLDTLINFAYLQAEGNRKWEEMLFNVIKEYTGASDILINLTSSYNNVDDMRQGYIDHQSHSSEGSNTEIFDDEETLKRFLFSSESYIQGDNDNH